ncbi:restriction endonuclease subunit S [Nostoc sp. TCL26-01]|uniref:restriction endonuclease subunit S n=1 Tax=Nostoc sp. TCL26-01 TaxID=2576904 RepID=UPI0015BD4211|nr:restriction endonuclease subunit S [Nostoc sp. TCL26-01]QLE58795.1 hypothetical protein FD725_26810 [Nostoc sp. TCL26-01]
MLPNSWIYSQIEDIAEISMGQSPPGDSYNVDGVGIPLINGPVEFGSTPFSKTIKSKFTTLPTKMCKEGDLILCVRGSTTGRMNIAGFDACIGRGVAAIRSHLYQQYLNIFIHFNQYQIHRLGTGSTFPNVSADILNKIVIPLPPLNEQRRIVAKIEALKARSQRVKEELEDIPQLLDQFRQSVLAAAFRGDLTADWREQDNKEFLDYDFPSTWKKGKLSDVVEGLKQGWSPKCKNFPSSSEDVWGVIKTTAVQSLRFVEEENKQLPSHLEPRPELELMEGDLLITRAGPRARAGVTCLVSSVRSKLMFCDKVYKFRAKESYVLPLYLAYFLNSPSIISLIDQLKTGISDSGVNLTQEKFLALPLWLPPIAEQQKIIERVKTLFKIIEEIEQKYQEANANLDQLDQSILAKAFRGELVPQDPDDEPASVLLERIRAERAKLQTKTAKKSTTKTSARRTKKTQAQQEEPVQLDLELE